MNISSSVILLTLTAWHLLLYRGWAGAPAVPAANTTGASCNTGSSRLVLANLDHLPQVCKPGHHAVAAAVFECFASWRVSVQNCRVTVVPGRAASRAGLDCRVMRAQGSLQGPTNATLIAVLDGSKVADLLPKLPGHSNSTLLQGLDAAKLQQQLLTGMQLLFSQVVVTHSSSRDKTNASDSTTQPATTAAEAVQPQVQASPGPVPASAPETTRGSSSSSGAAAGVRARRHRQRHRPRNRPQQQHNATDAAANAPQAPVSPPNSTHTSSATATVTTNSSSNASSSTGTTAGGDLASSQSKPPAAAATNSTGAAASNITAKHGQGAAAAPAHTPGRRRLLQQLMWTADIALSSHWPSLHRAWARPPAAGPEAVTAAGTHARQHQASSSTAAHTAPAAARQLTAASPTADRAQAAALYSHDGSIILQSNSRCSYQFLVTRNPGLFSMQPQPQQGLQHGASNGGEGISRKGSSWWISAGALFAGVSAVLALAICFMSAQLWARYKSYDALPTVPAPTEGEQQEQATGHSSTGNHIADASSQTTRGQPEMSLELQHTSSAKPHAEEDGDKALLQDQERS